ncbi:HAD family hydrolase [Microbulbifer hydrolyticus]|uniref:HAD superfamily hydrolase (TIGR01509 family) n=1 Tax=Microbulbifer hydrolyticus TaxID=48074 RepID=A0A6P1T502_9GAMM|nr:HAD family hydrolase [Microbulbifer hydrolyticus]MBB5211283.1 HAD superfamily hydrolase (TIGR01509 family) [Microbulbifer hydrolyticus]QHQ37954.1 HAD-IA family hydrolase [Microbulbifer hydrolyticus]
MENPFSQARLVIFDCDGVLVDSETIVCRVLAEEMTRLGMPATAEELDEQFSGRPSKDCILDIEARYGGPLPEAYFHNTESRIRRAFHEELEPVTGIYEVLEKLQTTDLQSCVASSGPHAKMQITLNKTGLWDFFEGRIFSADDVGRGKPWPDLFLHSARQFDIAPQRCLVVEDSIAGVKAAVAAGMPVIGYSHNLERGRQLEAEGARVINDMQLLLDYL